MTLIEALKNIEKADDLLLQAQTKLSFAKNTFLNIFVKKLQEKGLSLRQCAVKFDVSAQYLSDVVHGKRNLNKKMIDKIINL